MILTKLYSEPEGLFQTTTFKEGISFIYAKKDHPNDTKKSLNGVGKSLFVNLIDYCLLSSTTPHIKSAVASNTLADYRAVLEFEIDGNFYIIKSAFFNHADGF